MSAAAQVHGTGLIEEPDTTQKFDGVTETFVQLPTEPTREVRWDLAPDWNGKLDLKRDWIKGSRIKPVIFVPEERLHEIDRAELRSRILQKGATYCKAPEIHVIRKKVTRDSRHAADMPTKDSLKLFAEETKAREAKLKIAYALKLAVEADEGVRE